MIRELYTIGFAKKSLRNFVKLLKEKNVTHLIDVRLNNTSQLAGFAKKDDLEYVMELIGIKYIHEVMLAPDQDLLDDYKKKKISWDSYEKRYRGILINRNIKERIEEIIGDGTPCFLCSEHDPNQCHRKLLVGFIEEHSNNIVSVHLV